MITDDLGIRMAQGRNEACMTQRQVADMMGCSSVTVSRWETGKRKPSFKALENFADVVGKPLAWFLQTEAQTVQEFWQKVPESR